MVIVIVENPKYPEIDPHARINIGSGVSTLPYIHNIHFSSEFKLTLCIFELALTRPTKDIFENLSANAYFYQPSPYFNNYCVVQLIIYVFL